MYSRRYQINWIDSKACFGDEHTHVNNKEQYEQYSLSTAARSPQPRTHPLTTYASTRSSSRARINRTHA